MNWLSRKILTYTIFGARSLKNSGRVCAQAIEIKIFKVDLKYTTVVFSFHLLEKYILTFPTLLDKEPSRNLDIAFSLFSQIFTRSCMRNYIIHKK